MSNSNYKLLIYLILLWNCDLKKNLNNNEINTGSSLDKQTHEINKKHELLLKFNIPELQFNTGSIIRIDTLFSEGNKVYYFNFSDKSEYGSGALLTNITSEKIEKPIWIKKVMGDFPPHTLHLIDFNGDNHKDIYLLIGMEDVFVTEIFLKNPDKNTYDRVYQNLNCYATIIDIDNDNIPELLVGENNELSFLFPEKFDKIIANEHKTISGSYYNYHIYYGLTKPSYDSWMYLSDRFRMLKLEDDEFIDVTKNYKNHLKWRKDIIDSIIELNYFPEFKKRQYDISKYLDSLYIQ